MYVGKLLKSIKDPSKKVEILPAEEAVSSEI